MPHFLDYILLSFRKGTEEETNKAFATTDRRRDHYHQCHRTKMHVPHWINHRQAGTKEGGRGSAMHDGHASRVILVGRGGGAAGRLLLVLFLGLVVGGVGGVL